MSCGGQTNAHLADGSPNPRYNANAGAINDARAPYGISRDIGNELFHAEIQRVKAERGIPPRGGTPEQQAEVEAVARQRMPAVMAAYAKELPSIQARDTETNLAAFKQWFAASAVGDRVPPTDDVFEYAVSDEGAIVIDGLAANPSFSSAAKDALARLRAEAEQRRDEIVKMQDFRQMQEILTASVVEDVTGNTEEGARRAYWARPPASKGTINRTARVSSDSVVTDHASLGYGTVVDGESVVADDVQLGVRVTAHSRHDGTFDNDGFAAPPYPWRYDDDKDVPGLFHVRGQDGELSTWGTVTVSDRSTVTGRAKIANASIAGSVVGDDVEVNDVICIATAKHYGQGLVIEPTWAQASITRSKLTGNAGVYGSTATDSTISGSARIKRSTVTNVTVSDTAVTQNADVRNSTLTGSARIIGPDNAEEPVRVANVTLSAGVIGPDADVRSDADVGVVVADGAEYTRYRTRGMFRRWAYAKRTIVFTGTTPDEQYTFFRPGKAPNDVEDLFRD